VAVVSSAQSWLGSRLGYQVSMRIINIDREVKIIKFRGDPSRMSGVIEVRGIVNKDGTISFGEFTQYDNEFGKPYHPSFSTNSML
jgi:hypothetical protein